MKIFNNHKIVPGFVLTLILIAPQAHADFWGADLPILAQILTQAITEVSELQTILGTGRDSFDFLQKINKGRLEAMTLRETLNRTLRPGNLSNLSNVNELIRELQNIYGQIPNTSEAKIQSTQDLTVAESIQLHNDAFRYADEVDPEAERMKEYAGDASPQGAAKAGLQAQGVQIHVLNQILRTNAALLKVQSEQLAMQNRKAKLQSAQFRAQYGEFSDSAANFQPGFDLPSLSSAN